MEEEVIPCAADIELLAADIDIFLKGGINNDVVISGGKTLPSYRKYVISDLTRTGNNVQARTYFIDDVITYNQETYVCIKDNVITNVNNQLSPTDWQKVGNFSVVSGVGFDAYLSYDMRERKIISSANVASVIVSNQDSNVFSVKLTKEVPAGLNKLGVIFSVDVSSIPSDEIFLSQIQNACGNTDSYIGVQNSNIQYARGGAYPLASAMPTAKILSNSGNDYTIRVEMGMKYFNSGAGTGSSQRPPYTSPTYMQAYQYLNSADRGTFRPIVNLLFYIMP